jgi:hypothetical protein
MREEGRLDSERKIRLNGRWGRACRFLRDEKNGVKIGRGGEGIRCHFYIINFRSGWRNVIIIRGVIPFDRAILEVRANIKLVGKTIILYLVGSVRLPNVLNLAARDWMSHTNVIILNPLEDGGALFPRTGLARLRGLAT